MKIDVKCVDDRRSNMSARFVFKRLSDDDYQRAVTLLSQLMRISDASDIVAPEYRIVHGRNLFTKDELRDM